KFIKETGWQSAVLKVQVHAGGRGKAGGVKFAQNPQEMIAAAQELLGKKIITHQTGPEGLIAHSLLISQPIDIIHESYLGMTINREKGKVILLSSPVGGVEIEKIAQEQPEKLLVLELPEEGTFRSYHLIRIVKFMGWTGSQAEKGALIVKALTKAFGD